MSVTQMRYRELKCWKYQLLTTYTHPTGLQLIQDISTKNEWVKLSKKGRLTLQKGYSWDGITTGTTYDTKNFMRGSLVHDGLYQLMREGLLDREEYRESADRVLLKIILEDGMSKFRAWYVYMSIRFFGLAAAQPGYLEKDRFPPIWVPERRVLEKDRTRPIKVPEERVFDQRMLNMDPVSLFITIIGVLIALVVLFSQLPALFSILLDLFASIEPSTAYAQSVNEGRVVPTAVKSFINIGLIIIIVIAFFWALFITLHVEDGKRVARANDLKHMLLGFMIASAKNYIGID